MRSSPTQLCIHNQELLYDFSNICSNVHFWIALKLEELRHQQTQSLSTVLFIYTDELVRNVFGITVRQYRNRNPVDSVHSRSTPPSGPYPASRPTIFLINIRRLFIVLYIGTFPRSVNNLHHIILFEVHDHLPFPLGPIGGTNKLFYFNFRIRRHIFFR